MSSNYFIFLQPNLQNKFAKSKIFLLWKFSTCHHLDDFSFQVIFTTQDVTFDTLEKELRSGLYEKKFRISFETREIQQEFDKLLENRCLICSATFGDFKKLKDHVRKNHEKFYCEICTDALSLFSAERKFYSRHELARHRRIGDMDDKSHKGHPLCNYCELRFLDKDDLWRHLRREHNYCHFCDADGVNLFYGTINELRSHFKAEHFLCEEDDCNEEGMAIAFRSEIDLIAHRASVHSRSLSKQQARQARTLDIDFSYTNQRNERGGGGGRDRDRGENRHDGRRNNRDTQREFDEYQDNQNNHAHQAAQEITNNEEHFPSLVSLKPTLQLANSVRHAPMYGSSRLAKTEENFPQLAGGRKNESVKMSNTQKAPTSSSSLFKPQQQQNTKATKNSNKQQQNKQISQNNHGPFKDDFPALGPASSTNPAAMTFNHVKKVAAPPKKMITKTVVNEPKLKPKKPMPNGNKKTFDEDDDYSGFPTLTPVPTGFNMKKAIKYDSIIDSYSVPQNHPSHQKIQSIERKDDQMQELPKKSAPNLSSNDNFPSLGGSSSSSEPQKWVARGNANNSEKKIENFRGKPNPNYQENNQQKKSNRKHSFLAPQNAEKRNLALGEIFRKTQQSNESLQEFRNVSQLFRQGGYYAKSYYETCQHILGAHFDDIFPELLALLPSIDKQQVSRSKFHLEMNIYVIITNRIYGRFIEKIKRILRNRERSRKSDQNWNLLSVKRVSKFY